MIRYLSIAMVATLAAIAPASAVTFFDVSVDATSAGPPYPTSPTQTAFFQGDLPSPTQAGIINLGIHSATGTPLAAHVQAWDPNGGPEILSTSASFNVFLEASQPTPPMMSSSLFDIWVEPLTSGGLSGNIVSGGGGMSGGAGGGKFYGSFDAGLNVLTDDGGPRLLLLHGEIPAGQSVYFASGGTIQVVGSKLHITPNLVFAGPVNNAVPLITITMTPEPASMLLLLASAGLLRPSRRR
jgi:hypothetical protein